MKRTFLAVLSAALLLVVVPSVASAHHSKHHAACRAGTHKHHAKCARARAHVLSFGPTFSAPGAPAGAPAGSPPSGETAGTVTSYIAPILTITLHDKKTEVSGKVTENTRIECESPTPTGSGAGEEGDDDGGSEGSGDSGFRAGNHDSVMASAADSQGGGDDQGENEDNVQPCTTSALVPGTVVRSAELLLGGEGPVWEKILLVS